LAFGNGERDHLIRIVVSEGIASPKVERGNGEKVVVWVSPEMSYESIKDFINDKLTSPEIQTFKKLWTEDAASRNYEMVNGNLEITEM
jgi:hypothetical protein